MCVSLPGQDSRPNILARQWSSQLRSVGGQATSYWKAVQYKMLWILAAGTVAYLSLNSLLRPWAVLSSERLGCG